MTDPLGQSQVLPYIIELSKQGYRFTILSFEKKNKYHQEKNIIEKIAKKHSINWVPLFFTSRPPVLAKIYDRWKLLRKAFQLQRREKFDMIHCRSYIAAEAGLKLKQKTGVRFLFDMRGFWADERVDNGQWNLKKPFYRKLYSHYKKREKDFLLHADGIVSLTAAGKNYLLSLPEYEKIAIDVIPCCADLDHFDFNKVMEQQRSRLKNELGIPPNKKIITYSGSIGGWYMTAEMFDFYKLLVSKYPEYVMLILTKDDREKVVHEAEMAGISRERVFVKYALREQMPGFLGISDCSIFFIRPTFSKTASSPTKHAELMGMGIPVICNDIGDTGNIINATGTGAVLSSFTESSYRSVVEKLPELCALSKPMIRQKAFEYFDLKAGASAYEKLYKRILN